MIGQHKSIQSARFSHTIDVCLPIFLRTDSARERFTTKALVERHNFSCGAVIRFERDRVLDGGGGFYLADSLEHGSVAIEARLVQQFLSDRCDDTQTEKSAPPPSPQDMPLSLSGPFRSGDRSLPEISERSSNIEVPFTPS
jgi:hypothetical protein